MLTKEQVENLLDNDTELQSLIQRKLDKLGVDYMVVLQVIDEDEE